MVGKIQKILMVGLFSVASSAYSMETLIDFEDQGLGSGSFSELTIQNVNFSMFGVDGHFITVVEALEELSSHPDSIGFSNKALTFDSSSELTFSFENAVSAFSFSMLASSNVETWQLSAFDETDALVESVSLVMDDRFGSISSSVGNISYAILAKDGNYSSGLIIDNVRYTEVSPVPEPSSYALILGGLGLVGFMAYRRKKELS